MGFEKCIGFTQKGHLFNPLAAEEFFAPIFDIIYV